MPIFVQVSPLEAPWAWFHVFLEVSNTCGVLGVVYILRSHERGIFRPPPPFVLL